VLRIIECKYIYIKEIEKKKVHYFILMYFIMWVNVTFNLFNVFLKIKMKFFKKIHKIWY